MEKIKTNKVAGISAYAFIALMSGGGFIAVMMEGGQFKWGYLTLLLVSLLCVALVVKQLFTWEVRREEEWIYMTSFLGMRRISLDGRNDLVSVEGTVEFSDSDTKKSEYLILHTHKGKFTFHSPDYKNFELLVDVLFQQRPEIKADYYRQIRQIVREKENNKWTYFKITSVVGMVFLILWIIWKLFTINFSSVC